MADERLKKGTAFCSIAQTAIEFQEKHRLSPILDRYQCNSVCPLGKRGDTISVCTRAPQYKDDGYSFGVVECES